MRILFTDLWLSGPAYLLSKLLTDRPYFRLYVCIYVCWLFALCLRCACVYIRWPVWIFFCSYACSCLSQSYPAHSQKQIVGQVVVYTIANVDCLQFRSASSAISDMGWFPCADHFVLCLFSVVCYTRSCFCHDQIILVWCIDLVWSYCLSDRLFVGWLVGCLLCDCFVQSSRTRGREAESECWRREGRPHIRI